MNYEIVDIIMEFVNHNDYTKEDKAKKVFMPIDECDWLVVDDVRIRLKREGQFADNIYLAIHSVGIAHRAKYVIEYIKVYGTEIAKQNLPYVKLLCEEAEVKDL